jgi:hypothetical protein
MSTDSPIKYNSDRVLTKAQKDINDDHHYWDWFDAWWDQDFSWWVEEKDKEDSAKPKGLAAHKIVGSDQTLQDYWREEEDRLIPFGKDKNGKLRQWTRFHLPPHDRDGNPSEKPFGYVDWKQPEWRNWHDSILEKIRAATPYDKFSIDTRARLQGICFPDHFDLSYDEEKATSTENQMPKKRHLCADWALFVGISNFDNTDFGKNVSFNYAMFSKWASFDGAQFTDKAIFLHTYFLGAADFKDNKTSDKNPTMLFEHAIFLGQVDFIDRAFGRGTSFSNASFHSIAKFHGCKFHQDTSFSDAFFEVPGKGIGILEDFWLSALGCEYTETEPYQRAFRTLRQLMENNVAYAEAYKFGRLEQIAKERRITPFTWPLSNIKRRETDVPCWERWLSHLYGRFADYGQSVGRPMCGLIILWG